MSRPNGVVAPMLLSLVVTFLFSSRLTVFASPVQVQTFKRPDPLNGLKDYYGEYNVTDKHYWASAAFTGVHGYAIAGVWLLFGLCFGIFATCKSIARKSSPLKHHLNYYYFMFFLVIVFTFLSLIATSLVLAANEASLDRTRKLKGTVLKAGADTRRTIRRVVKVMTQMESLLRPYDPGTTQRLFNISHLLAKESNVIQLFIEKSGQAIDLAIQTSHIIHVVIVTVNLTLLVASLVLLFLHWRPGFITIIFACWILTTLCWALAGLDFFLHTFADDTCTAFYDFEQNPQNSSLGAIIPCVDPTFSAKILADIGSTIHNFISQLNVKIRELYIMVALQGINVDMLGFGKVCDPFSGPPDYTYMPEKCPPDAIPIGNLPNVLSYLTCYRESSTQACKDSGKIIPQSFYDMARAYSRSVQDLLDMYPDLASLTKCIVVKMTFSNLVKHQCRPFRSSIKFLWASVISLSVVMSVLVMTWVAKAFQERGRRFSRCSIVPEDPPLVSN